MVLSSTFVLFPGARAASPDIRYVAIGDSYSSGEGASVEQAWPAVLAHDLTRQGTRIDLIANPSRTGWTADDAIRDELPIAVEAKPDFVTVQIGVNDWVSGVDLTTFRERFTTLLDGISAILPNPRRLLLITIPDFSVTPAGTAYGEPLSISQGIAAFNKIIFAEAARRHLRVVDVFGVSRHMRDIPGLIANDGLHPTAREYAIWEKLILPVAADLLKKTGS